MSKVVAVTGGIGSGKTEVCNCFMALGVPVVDLDRIAHDMSAPNSIAMQAVRAQFGDSMFDANGQLNRAKLRELVFAEPDALDQLNQIMHPAIRQEAMQQIAQYADAYVVLAIPLLVESREDWQMVDHVLVVDCDAQTQLTRVVQRSQAHGEKIDLVPAVLVGAAISSLLTLPLAFPFVATPHDIGLLALLAPMHRDIITER